MLTLKYIVQLPVFWLLMALLIGFVCYWKKNRKGLRLSIFFCLFWLLSVTPLGASLWLSSLTLVSMLADSDELLCPHNTSAVIVMPGGMAWRKGQRTGALSQWSKERVIKTLSLIQQRKIDTVIIPGGHKVTEAHLEADIMQQFFKQYDLNVNFLVTGVSDTSYENLQSIRSVVNGKRDYYLVTSYWHMPRAVKTARKLGFNICPIETPRLFRSSIVPALEAHWKTKAAIHEWLALLWYWLSNRI